MLIWLMSAYYNGVSIILDVYLSGVLLSLWSQTTVILEAS